MFITAHKHFKTIIMVATRSLDDKGWVLVGGSALRLLRVVFLLSLWRMLLPESGEVSGMTRNAVLTYTLIAEVFAGQISVRTGLDGALWRGDIANRFLRPVGIYGQFIAEMFGSGLPNLILFSVPLFCLAPLLGVDPLPESAFAGVLFLCSLILGIAIGAAFDFIFASFMVLLEQHVYALTQIRDAVSVLLSGAIIPLALMPWGIGDVLTFLPFASLASAPLRIYTGTGDPVFPHGPSSCLGCCALARRALALECQSRTSGFAWGVNILKTLTTLFARWRVQAYLDFMWMTRDFRFFLINIVSDIILNLAGVTAVFLLAERFEGIGLWSRDQIVFMLGYAALVRGFLDVGFSYNVLHISRRIGRGQMDHTLVQPQPVWMGLLTEGFMPFSGSWSLLTGIGIWSWAIFQLDAMPTMYWWLMFVCNLDVFLRDCAIFFFCVGESGFLGAGCRGRN